MSFEHRDIKYCMYISLKELNRVLLEEINSHHYPESTLVNEARGIRVFLQSVGYTEISIEFLTDKVTQSVLDLARIRGSV